MAKTGKVADRLSKIFYDAWEEEKATEVATARDSIIGVLKERKVSLPAAIFALDLVKFELLRAQLNDFLGHAQLDKSKLPLASKNPENVEAK